MYLLDRDVPIAVVHPGVGAPLAAGFLEEVIGLGGRAFIAVGGAGALVPDLTLGHVIVFTREPTPHLWRHELAHVAQYERYGLAFLPLYLWLYARHGYASHPFEREAQELARLDA